jgi:chemotaxis regulatin CheY-phosphate phosphatase CheZ
MKSNQIERIVRKVEELKALFVFGQRVMPFLEDLFYFIQEIAPLLEEINASLRESSKKMPKASTQLNKVTEATELATTEILDMVDAIGFKLNGIQTNLNRFKSYSDLQEDLSRKMKRRLTLIEQKYPDDQDIQSMRELWDKVDQASNLIDPLQTTQTHIGEIRQLTGNIMIALQVQDITSQQIAAVNHLIESVQGKLNTLLEQLANEPSEGSAGIPKIVKRKVAFDPNAEYTRAGEKQYIADDVVQEALRERDKIVEEVSPVEAAVVQKPAQTIDEAASQDDIDALFK